MEFKRLLPIFLILCACGAPPREKALSILSKGVKDPSVIIRLNAARGLHETGDASGMKVITEILGGSDKEGVVGALDALCDLGEKTCTPAILKLHLSDDPLIRAETFRLLSQCADPAQREAIRAGILDKIGKVRKYAYLGLEHFQDRDALHRGLRDVDPAVRLICAQVLGRLGEPGMENFIKNELNKNKTPEFWVDGCAALAGLRDTTAVPFLKELLVDMPWDIRIAAATALLELRKRDGVPVIKEGLTVTDPFIRVKCVDVINRYPLPEFYDDLRTATDDVYINVTIGAVRALVKCRKPESKMIFAKLLDAPSPLVRIAAASAFLQTK